MELGTYLKNQKLSTTAFGAQVGCSRSHISLICTKRRRPSADVAFAIEQATHGSVTLRELLFPELFDRPK
jgi:DNA-binding transcriptional regulator YdaS (Cro superfamily)